MKNQRPRIRLQIPRVWIDTKKWNVFYTKVLAKFASNPNLKITVKFEVEDDATSGEQKKEETKTALREMGLDENI